MFHPLRAAIFSASRQAATKQSAALRCIATSSIRWDIFNVQSIEDFDRKVKQSDKPVVVDFFATWCNPCKMLTPRIESIIDEKEGAIRLAKVDIDEHSELALDYDVGAVPVLMVMKGGKVVNRIVGLQDTDKLRDWVEKAVKEAE